MSAKRTLALSAISMTVAMGLMCGTSASAQATTAPSMTTSQSAPSFLASRTGGEEITAAFASNLQPSDQDARIVAVLPIIIAVITAGGSVYGMGQVAGQRSFHAGLRNTQYQQIKWQVRANVVAMLGVVAGPIFMTGFENAFYSLS